MARENEKVGNEETDVMIFTLDENVLLFNPTKCYINRNILEVQGKIIWADNLENIKKMSNLKLCHFRTYPSLYKHENNSIRRRDLLNGTFDIIDNDIIWIKSSLGLLHEVLLGFLTGGEKTLRFNFFRKIIVNNRELINHLPNSWKQLIVENF